MDKIHERLVMVPDPRLRQVCSDVTKEDGDLTELIGLMVEVMEVCRGVGINTSSISAPQVGVMKRLFIIFSPQVEIVAINPIVTKATGKQNVREGCLSFPKGALYLMPRPDIVKFHYQDLAGKPRTSKFHDLYAAMVMHENDHLNGILIDDNGTPLYGR
jgi:peptide deformylase